MPHIVVTVHRAEGVKWKSIFPWRKAPKLYVEVACGNPRKEQKTQVIYDLAPQWNAKMPFEVKDTDETFRFYLRRRTLLRRDPSMGTVDIKVADLISQSRSGAQGEVPLLLGKRKDRKQTQSPLTIHISAKEADAANENDAAKDTDVAKESSITQESNAVKNAKAALDLAQKAIGKQASDVMDSVSTVVGNLQSLSTKLGSVTSVIMDKMGDLAELHPYANIAWKVCSSLYEAAKQKNINDETLLALVETMNDTFAFVNDLENLPNKIKHLELVITRVLEQTTECSLFIRNYVDRGSTANIFLQLWQSQKPKIDEFKDAFANLQKDLGSGALLHNTLVTFKISEDVSALLESDLMRSLKPSSMNLANSKRRPCLFGTRTTILDHITEWALQREGHQQQNILWLHGVAGSGKSTIATTIAEHFDKIGRRGAYLFFERSKNDPASIVRTLAHKLAEFDSSICKEICDSIKAKRGIAEESLENQFVRLLQRPLIAAAEKLTGPIVIVLDALDECGDEDSRRLILKLLVEELPKLPPIFRFLFTSRRERDVDNLIISNPLSIKPLWLRTKVGRHDSDVHKYIRSEMKEIRELNSDHGLSDDWPGENTIDKLAEYSEGLFIWVSTVSKFLRDETNPVEQLRVLLTSRNIQGLDSLYATALEVSCRWTQDQSWDHFRSVMAAVLFSRKQLNDQTIDRLLGLSDANPCRVVLARLQCLLDYTPGGPIRPLHASFRDYLIDEKRSGEKPWSLSSFNPEHHLASCCFTVMSNQLCFNICKVKSSYWSGNVETNLGRTRKEAISLELEYASNYWSDHLSAVHTRNDPLILMLGQFSHTQLLFWLELVSLQVSDSLWTACSNISTFIKNYNPDLSDLWEDVKDFIVRFHPIIVGLLPHMYLSALPFTPPQSQIRKIYGPLFPNTVQVFTEEATPNDTLGTGGITYIGFSPDGKMLVCCFRDGSVQIRRTSDYVILSEYSSLHQLDGIQVAKLGLNNSVVYCLIGQGTLVAWERESTATVTLYPASVSDFEVQLLPSSERVLAVCADGSIYVWTREGLNLKFGLLVIKVADTNLTSIAVANNGQVAVSGSAGEVMILDLELDLPSVITSFKINGDSQPILTFSSDNMFLAVAGDRQGVYIWSMKTEESVILSLGTLSNLTPFYQYKNLISITWINLEHILAIGFNDGSVSLFNIDAKQVVVYALCDINRKSMHVAVSPDGTTLAAGSSNIHIWDPIIQQQSKTILADDLGMNAKIKGTHLTQLPSRWPSKNLGNLAPYYQGFGAIYNPWNACTLIIPAEDEEGLYWFGQKHIIGPELKTRLDISRFVYGDRWAECYQPNAEVTHVKEEADG
ncbi:hypothetical protein QCA50_010382 [Cerrena zonata]|uniref:C2 domain-containing protein n=1 Tax=Cerrena zonata TaxID=2478898 RepID=A0AAW0G3R5_9APHY